MRNGGWYPNFIESENRDGMKIGLTIILFLMAFAWFGLGAIRSNQSKVETVQREIRAQRYMVVDDTGKVRAEFGILPNGQTGMVVWDKGKSTNVSLTVDRNGTPRLDFANSNGASMIELGVLNQSPAFIMRSADGKRRLGTIVTESGSVGFGLYDSAKQDRCMLYVGRDGHPKLTLKDDKGKVRARLMIDSSGTCALDMLDRNGKERIVSQVDSQGETEMAILGQNGKPVWTAK